MIEIWSGKFVARVFKVQGAWHTICIGIDFNVLIPTGWVSLLVILQSKKDAPCLTQVGKRP